MSRLLVSNFARLVKNKLFWCLCGVIAILSVLMVVWNFSYPVGRIDGAVCSYVVFIEAAAAIFTSLFVGTEYGDGTIRNKLIVGHDRRHVYAANLITSIIASFGFVAAYMIPVLLIGFPLIGLPSSTTVAVVFAGIMAQIAFCSLYTMVSMIFMNKTGATAVNLVLAFVLLLASVFLCSILEQPEFIPGYGEDGTFEYFPNKNYPSAAEKIVLHVILNVIPAGQAVKFIMGITTALWSLPLYSAVFGAVCTAVGMVVFGKEDVK